MCAFSLGADVTDLPHVGEYDMVLALVHDPAAHGQVGIHTRVVHEMLNENVETPQIGRLRRDNFENGLHTGDGR